MAADALQELRSTIERQLRRFWSADAPSNPRFGVKNTAPPNALRKEVAEEIAEMLRKDPTKEGYFGSLSEDSAGTNSLPLGARLKPRGIFEDDWTARPHKDRPWPIILLHGTADSKGIWQALGGELREDGWAVFAPDYGTRATGLLSKSAVQVGAYIDAVLTMTGTHQVIIAGHSQGGLLARYWMRVLGGASKVRHLISLGAPNHGTTEGGIISPLMASKRTDSIMKSIIQAFFGEAGQQQIVGSEILNAVNHGGDLDEGVTYTCIATHYDAVVVPPETCFLSPSPVEDGVVRNIYVQDFDSHAVVLHHDLPTDRRVRAIVRTIVRQL